MDQADTRSLKERLGAPFPPTDVEWRVQASGLARRRDSEVEEWWVRLVPYVNARAIQQRLDDVVGPEGWEVEYKANPTSTATGGLLCGISLYVSDARRVTKWDGSGEMKAAASGRGLSEEDAMKGSISTAFKRAAVAWGIGRYLYGIDASYATILSDTEAKRFADRAFKVEAKSKDGKTAKLWVLPPALPGEMAPATQRARDQRREMAAGQPK